MKPIHDLSSFGLRWIAASAVGIFVLSCHNTPAWSENPRWDAFNSQLVEQIQRTHNGKQHSDASRAELVRVAQQRKAEMLDILEQDPGSFLEAALPAAVRRAMPAEARVFVESEVTLEGELEVIQVDALDPEQSELTYYLKRAGTSERFRLHFASRPPLLKGGTKVKVEGLGLGREVVLASGGKKNVKTIEAVDAEVSGNRTAIAMVIRFEDKAEGCSAPFVDDLLFGSAGSVDQYYREASFNNLSVTGRVHPEVITIPYSSTGACDPYGWAQAADAAAAAGNPDFGDFNHRVYVLPHNSCSYAGLGNVGGDPARAWVMGYCSIPDIYAHEIGHNFGMHHGATPSNQYGDYSDIMGYSNVGLRHANAPHKHEMGWVPESKVETVSQDGTHAVGALESASLLPHALRLVKPDTNDEYYISYRVPAGFDSVLRSEYRYRANIHTWQGPGNKTYFRSVLDDGGEFVDAINGVTVKQVRHDAESLTLQVSYSGAQCEAQMPDMTLDPVSQSAAAGGEATYTVTLYNNDSAACSAADFTFVQSLPQGWSGRFSQDLVNIFPGEESAVGWTVSVPDAESDGNFVLNLEAVKEGSEGMHSSINTNFAVLTELTPPSAPSVRITSPADEDTVSRNTNIVADTENSEDIKEVRLYINGALAGKDKRADYEFRWNTRKEASGSYRLRVEAENNSGQSASDEITVWVD